MNRHQLIRFWLILSLLPAPFLFHYYEYGQHFKQESATFLFWLSVLYVVVTGLLSGQVKIRYILFVHVLTGILSVYLATCFILDDGGWFAPVGRNGAVVFAAIVSLIGQLIVRVLTRNYYIRKNK